MAERNDGINRRRFLLKGASILAGNFIGFGSLSKALAQNGPRIGLHPKPRIALIIDDIGFNLTRAHEFLDLGIPMTFSILPKVDHTRELATEINYQGREIMLHQPMEPFDSSVDPGPGALYVGDRSRRVFRIINENLAEVPFAIGVNNHMGSRLTAEGTEMTTILEVVKRQRLFFIDSVTSTRSIAYKTAKGLEMAAARRDIFLDFRQNTGFTIRQLIKLREKALTRGSAIGIGHPYRETVEALRYFLKSPYASDISFVYASQVIHT